MIYLDARQQRTERIINPLQIRRARGETILIAHCQMRDDRRTFKLDRIVELKRLEESPTGLATSAASGPATTAEMPENLWQNPPPSNNTSPH
jgi:predicted DNA-binding transcriptional regulator YafY